VQTAPGEGVERAAFLIPADDHCQFDILQSGPGWWDRMQFDRLRRRWLQDEVAKLRRELAAARAEFDPLRAIDTQRDPDSTLN